MEDRNLDRSIKDIHRIEAITSRIDDSIHLQANLKAGTICLVPIDSGVRVSVVTTMVGSPPQCLLPRITLMGTATSIIWATPIAFLPTSPSNSIEVGKVERRIHPGSQIGNHSFPSGKGAGGQDLTIQMVSRSHQLRPAQTTPRLESAHMLLIVHNLLNLQCRCL